MGTVAMIARRELHGRWSSLVSLAVLVAIVSGAVLTALVGAYRTSTTIDRFREWAGASDVTYQAPDAELAAAMIEVLEEHPDVELVGMRSGVNAFLPEASLTDIFVVTDAGGVWGTELDRPRLVAGRYPDPDDPDEVLLNELTARVTGFGVGDTVTAQSWSEQDLEALFVPDSDFPGFNGPELELHVVGVGRTPEELPGDAKRGGLYAIGSPSFLAGHPGVGAWPPAVVVQLRGGSAEIESASTFLREELLARGLGHPDAVEFLVPTTASEVYLETTERTVDSLSLALLLFAVSATAAGALVIGPAITRQVAGSSASLRILAALGLTGTETAAAISLPIAAAGSLGVVVGSGAAVAASTLLPIGLARRAEVDAGVWVAPIILVPAGVLLVVGLAAWSFVTARRTVRGSSRGKAEGGRRVSLASRMIARSGASPTVATGVRMAGDRGRGAGAVPVRSAFVGVAIGVAGVVGAAVVVASFDEVTGDPANWGWNWSATPDYFGDGDISALETEILADERIEAVAESFVGGILVNEFALTSYAMHPLKGSITYTRLDGRLPAGPSEIAFGRRTLDELGVAFGDTVTAKAADGTERDLVVVGTVVLPPTDEYRLDVGAVLTPDGRSALQVADTLSTLVLQYPDGADADALEAALTDDYGLAFSVFTRPQVPGSIRHLGEGRHIAIALGGFFISLGVAGLFHALVVSTRRRLGDLAVLRALGLGCPQVRRAISIEALVLGTAGLVAGIPLGLVAGRFIWRAMLEDLGVVSDPEMPWFVIAVSVPASMVLALLASWRPGHAAVRDGPAQRLRSE